MRSSGSRQLLLPALAVLSLLAGACGGDPDSPSPEETSASPTPTVSPEDYQKDLTAALEPLAAKLAVIPKAGNLTALQKRLGRAQDAAEAGVSDVSALTPPENAATDHTQLVSALSTLGAELGGISEAVDSQELCAPSSALAELGTVSAFSALPEAVEALAAKDIKVDFAMPKTPVAQNRRLANGTFVRAGDRNGRGELQIENGTADDAIITLAEGKSPAFTVYVRGGASYTVDGVPDGTYTIFYAIGQDWDRRSKSFTRNCGFKRFDKQAEFETTYSGNYVYNTIQQIGLQPRVGGNASTSDVAPEDFPG